MNLKEFCEKHWYTIKDRIDFEWDRYWDWIPSITTILKLINDQWLEYIKKNYSKELELACDNWKIVHKDAEDFFKKDWSSFKVSPQIMKFHVLYGIKSIALEERVIKDGIQGNIDLIAHSQMLETILNIDYKNTQLQSPKYFVQLMWYKYLNWYDWLLVYAGKWKLKVVLVPDEYYDVFIELKDLFFKLKEWQQ